MSADISRDGALHVGRDRSRRSKLDFHVEAPPTSGVTPVRWLGWVAGGSAGRDQSAKWRLTQANERDFAQARPQQERDSEEGRISDPAQDLLDRLPGQRIDLRPGTAVGMRTDPEACHVREPQRGLYRSPLRPSRFRPLDWRMVAQRVL